MMMCIQPDDIPTLRRSCGHALGIAGHCPAMLVNMAFSHALEITSELIDLVTMLARHSVIQIQTSRYW